MNNFDKLATDYVDYLRVKNYKESTIRNKKLYISQLRKFLIKRKVKDINFIDGKILEKFIVYMKTAPIGNWIKKGKPKKLPKWNVVREKLLNIGQFFKWSAEKNKILFNPFDKIIIPPTELRLPKDILTETEIMKLLNAPDLHTDLGRRDRAMIELVYSSALRRAELVTISLLDIDLTNGQAFIRQGKPRKDRVVPLGKSACKYIQLYLEQTRPYLMTDSKINNLFVSVSTGEPITPGRTGEILTYYKKQINFKKKVSWHTIRHTCATHLLQNGADVQWH